MVGTGVSGAGNNHLSRSSAGRARFALLLLYPFLVWTSAFGGEMVPVSNTPAGEVLILNSYHPGFNPSDEEQSTIVNALRQNKFDTQPDIEYLDYRHYPRGEHLKELLALLRKKYQKKKYSLLVALNNPALNLAVKHHAELFHKTPIVFCGVSNFNKDILAGDTHVTGVVSTVDLAGTIEIMLRLHPHTREILILHDYTVAGLAVRKDFEAVLPRFAGQVRFRFNKNSAVEEIFKELEGLPQNNLVLLLVYGNDSTGKTFDFLELTRLFSRHSSVPLYGHTDGRLGRGIVGGKLSSPKIVAAEAVPLISRILRGEDVRTIPVVNKSNAQYMFDYQQMERFHIPLASLPPNSIVINRTESFYAAHKDMVWTVSVIIGVLALVIVLLAVTLVQRRRAARALRVSEEKYYDLYENAPDMYYSVDVKTGKISECNETLARATGYTKKELIGRPIFELFHPDCTEEAKNAFQLFPAKGEVRNAERQVIRKDGSTLDVSLNVSAVKDEQGNIISSRSIWRDITERKLMEKELKTISITDMLTGLYNRRGFITLAEQQLKQAERNKKGLMLLFADLDNLKHINDNSGHEMGDKALIEVADVFKKVFRKMDIIARVGGDEFAALASEASGGDAAMITNRLQDQLDSYNAVENRAFTLSLSIGVTYYDPAQPISLDELMARADSLMYEQKMGKRRKFI